MLNIPLRYVKYFLLFLSFLLLFFLSIYIKYLINILFIKIYSNNSLMAIIDNVYYETPIFTFYIFFNSMIIISLKLWLLFKFNNKQWLKYRYFIYVFLIIILLILLISYFKINDNVYKYFNLEITELLFGFRQVEAVLQYFFPAFYEYFNTYIVSNNLEDKLVAYYYLLFSLFTNIRFKALLLALLFVAFYVTRKLYYKDANIKHKLVVTLAITTFICVTSFFIPNNNSFIIKFILKHIIVEWIQIIPFTTFIILSFIILNTIYILLYLYRFIIGVTKRIKAKWQ